MSKDDMETNTMNVMFSGKEEKDDKDDEFTDKRTERIVKYFEDDYYWTIYSRRNISSR